MVVGPGDHGLQADIIFVVEGTAISGAYLNDMKTNYVIPTLEYFSHGTIDERDYVAESTSTQYGLVVYQAADCLPNPSSNCYGPYSSPQRLLGVLDKIELVGGKGESHANIAEGLATALQCFEDLQQRREPNILPQKHCILVCNSPPYLLPVMESPAFSGHTVEKLAGLLQERGIHLSILSPRKIPALFKLYENAGGDLQISQTKNYAKDPRHLVLLKGYSLKERPISPTPGLLGPHIPNIGSIPSLPSPVANIGSPQQTQQVVPTSTAAPNLRLNQQNPPPMMPNQQQQSQQPQQQQQQQGNLTTNLVVRGFPQTSPGYPRPTSRWPMPPPQQRSPYMPQNNQTSSALIAQLTQPPPGVNQATLNNPFGTRMDNNVIMNTQPSMNNQPMRLPVSGLMPQQPGAPGGPIMNPPNMVVPGSVPQGPGQAGPPQGQQNPAGPVPGQAVQTGPQQSQPGGGQPGAAPGAAGPQSQAPPGGNQPQQQQQQPGPVRERHTIWQGVLEWIEKAKNPNDPQKLTRHVPCQVSANPKDGEPDLKADSWPQKLIMQLMPKQLIGNIGGAYLKNSKSVLFHPQQCEALESLTKVMSSGFAGCVHFTSMPSPSSCDIKVLILLYTSEKRAYLGFIPNDQAAFVDRLRKVIQHQKTTQALIRQQGQVGNAGGNPSGAGGPQQPQLTGPMSGPAGGPQQNQQPNNPQQGPQGGILMSQTNQLALGGGQITQNVVTSAAQQMQQVPLGQPGGGAVGAGSNQPSPVQMQALQGGDRHLGAPGGNQQQQQQQQQAGGSGPLRGQGMMGGPPQRPPFDHIEAARQQNLAKIQHLRQTLEAAQQQELQYKSQLEIISHMKIQQLQQNLEHAQQQEVQYKAQIEEQQKQPRAQLQQQLFQQQQQQQQQQRQMNPQNMQPNQPQQQQQPNQQQQQRLMRPGLPNNPGLRHLLQQQPQFRQQVLNTMQLNGPRGQQNPGSQGQPQQQFEDSFDFLS